MVSSMREMLNIPTGRPARVSLGDVAEAAGVSKATVCRVLRGTGRISKPTRERIFALAAEMGYEPDPALSALTRYRWGSKVSARSTYAIAVVSVDALAGKSPPKPAGIARVSGVQTRAAELKLIIEEHDLGAKTSPASLSRTLFARGIDGIVFHISGPIFQWDFPWEKFACVTIGFDGEAHRLNSVTSDWFSAVRMAVSRARQAGYQRIGFANFFRGNPSMDSRIQAATLLEKRSLEKEVGPQPKEHWYPRGGVLTGDIFRQEQPHFLKWFEKEKPDVVVDGNSMAHWWLKDAGVRIPKDVGYISLNADPLKEADVSGLVHQRERQGRLAVDLLYNLIQVNERGMSDSPIRLTTSCVWHPGASLGRSSARKHVVKKAVEIAE